MCPVEAWYFDMLDSSESPPGEPAFDIATFGHVHVSSTLEDAVVVPFRVSCELNFRLRGKKIFEDEDKFQRNILLFSADGLSPRSSTISISYWTTCLAFPLFVRGWLAIATLRCWGSRGWTCWRFRRTSKKGPQILILFRCPFIPQAPSLRLNCTHWFHYFCKSIYGKDGDFSLPRDDWPNQPHWAQGIRCICKLTTEFTIRWVLFC